MAKISEENVHQHLYNQNLNKIIKEFPGLDCASSDLVGGFDVEQPLVDAFELSKIIKARALEKLQRINRAIKNGVFIGSKIKLPTDNTTPMELDMLGRHSGGLFILELKVERSAERNAFSELFAYSNYLAEMFALSGHKDITNVLIARLENKITRQAFLYDLLILDRDIVVYQPSFPDEEVKNLCLDIYIPTDDDFSQFANDLISHDNISCVIASFHDEPGWFDSEEDGDGKLKYYTTDFLSGLATYAGQLMEKEHLHGFCFIRKPWKEKELPYRNSLFVCAINPFVSVHEARFNKISEQLEENYKDIFQSAPMLGFRRRLINIADRAIKDCLCYGQRFEFEPEQPWSAILSSASDVVQTHNFGFRITGILREAYVGYLNWIYELDAHGVEVEDLSGVKVEVIQNWYQAWSFMFSRSKRQKCVIDE